MSVSVIASVVAAFATVTVRVYWIVSPAPTAVPDGGFEVLATLVLGDEAAGDAEGLLKAFGEIAAAHPDSPFARLFLGISLEKRGDLDAATAEYRKSNDLDPSLQVVRICLSRTLAAQARAKRLHEDRDGALALFQEAAAFNPENPEARSGMLELAPAPGAGNAAPR